MARREDFVIEVTKSCDARRGTPFALPPTLFLWLSHSPFFIRITTGIAGCGRHLAAR